MADEVVQGGQKGQDGNGGPAWLGAGRFAIAVLALAAFAVFVLYLLRHSDVAQARWERYVYLLTGIEAIVFAAVGWLFGREVSRPVVAQAKEAGQAKETAAAERAKGRALACAVVAHETAEPKRTQRLQRMGVPDAAAAAPDISALADLARSQYTDIP
jgi:hypothetical protein